MQKFLRCVSVLAHVSETAVYHCCQDGLQGLGLAQHIRSANRGFYCGPGGAIRAVCVYACPDNNF